MTDRECIVFFSVAYVYKLLKNHVAHLLVTYLLLKPDGAQDVVLLGLVPMLSGISLSRSCFRNCREHDDWIVAVN